MGQSFRTDRNNNPAAFTTDIAALAKLQQGIDYTEGEEFVAGSQIFHTAKLLKDPVALTIKVIDAIGFYTKTGAQRWLYIGMPSFIWHDLDLPTKARVVQFMYHHEGGSQLEGLFAK